MRKQRGYGFPSHESSHFSPSSHNQCTHRWKRRTRRAVKTGIKIHVNKDYCFKRWKCPKYTEHIRTAALNFSNSQGSKVPQSKRSCHFNIPVLTLNFQRAQLRELIE